MKFLKETEVDYRPARALMEFMRDNLELEIPLLVCGEICAGKTTFVNELLSCSLDKTYYFGIPKEH